MGLGRILAGADHGGQRSFERSQGLREGDVGGRMGQGVAAARAAGREDEAGLAQRDDELLEVGAGEVLVGGDLGQLTGMVDDGSQPAGQLHEHSGRRTRPSC